MTEAQLCEANGLVARFYATHNQEAKCILQAKLMALGIELDKPILEPDPRAPAGGSAIAVAA